MTDNYIVHIQYWRWESFPCLTVSHKFPRDTLCPVVIWSISEHFCDYHGTWLSPRYNHRNFQTWVITTELSGHDVSCGNLWDTVRHGKLSHRQYCSSKILFFLSPLHHHKPTLHFPYLSSSFYSSFLYYLLLMILFFSISPSSSFSFSSHLLFFLSLFSFSSSALLFMLLFSISYSFSSNFFPSS